MTNRTERNGKGVVNTTSPDNREELKMGHRLLVGLRYHIQAQDLLTARKTKQRAVTWIAVVVSVLTMILAITR
ncbi:hypothetical protein ACFOET_14175 [Parapedobacter deserti]|uniref:Uncharacterized protein n=1 Tax=Parapedobacter deserti TaxID=1912957 RepID=A0ABV7JKZ7_9SPHI